MTRAILIIEDDNFLQGLEAKKMKKEGYDVYTASNSVEAFRILDKKIKIDMILLDLMLPDVDGFEILRKMRAMPETSSTPVIVFSNLSEEEDIKKAREIGISEFMIKSNFTLDQLAEQVKNILG
ncbi:MAG: PleD family two-component system response regulator [Candidatus Paceibacterota bacterium]